MQKVDVMREILEWSITQPLWQRDALRRLVTHGNLDESGLEELTILCKSAHGLAERREAMPLEEHHIPPPERLDVVKLDAIIHHSGVNALAKDQRIEFGPELTVVYGANASGKSGFIRILKRACRARGGEEILGNVLAESAPGRPSATIRFEVGNQKDELIWSDQETKDALRHVSVFDSHCAAVYLKEKTDVAFRPFGLDLFDKLSDACEAVHKVLEKENKALETIQVNLPKLPEGTAAQLLVSEITSLTEPEEVKKLGTLSDAEKEHLKEIRKRLHDLQAEDPKKVATILTLKVQRLDLLSSHLTKIEEVLADNSIMSLFEARDAVETARRVAETLRATTFPPGLLTGTGSDLWHELWEAARRFSTEQAYPDGQFPVTGEKARCVLCQQGLGDDATDRLTHFEKFLQSTVQQELERVRANYQLQYKRLEDLVVTDESNRRTLEELRMDVEELAKSIEDCLKQVQLRQAEVLKALIEGQPMPKGLPIYKQYAQKVSAEARALHDRAERVLRNSNQEDRIKLSNELRELEARENLGENLKAVLDEIERKKKLAAYQVCLRDTDTRRLTFKSIDVTTRAVTQQLENSFNDELKELFFTHLEVGIQSAGGSRGALYHKLVLKRAVGIDLPLVVSEGEARCLSIASFFAELSTSSNKSAIIFDDPVSSLDHNWRENVARRVAKEAKVRQVIVFTHDIVFLLALIKFAEEVGTSYQHQYLRREVLGSGISSPELPWVALKVKDRIGVLKNMLQSADKLYRTATRDDFEREAIIIYGRLREAWERGIEEVLLNGVVERYRPSVDTKRAKHLFDIELEDCHELDRGMTKCSRWLPGHDQAPAENAAVPDPAELKIDIDALEKWVDRIRKRRQN